MPLDPDLKSLMDKAPALPALETLSAPEARAIYEARPKPPGPEVAGVAERVLAGPGGDLSVRIYTPAGTGPFPLLVFFHGSGFVLCSLNTHDGLCRHLCAGSGYVVVSVDYRLAPEAPFPAAVDDCVFATRWAGENAASLNASLACLVVGGDSAGGNMAAVTALRIRDEGGPELAGQLLIYPVTDFHTPGTASYRENAEGYGLTRAGMIWFWRQYASKTDATRPNASPLRAPSLAGLPPALVHTAEFDVLRDEGEEYAMRLAEAGVPVHAVRWDGMTHGFIQLTSWVAKADSAVRDASDWLRGIADRSADCGNRAR